MRGIIYGSSGERRINVTVIAKNVGWFSITFGEKETAEWLIAFGKNKSVIQREGMRQNCFMINRSMIC